LDKTQLPLDEGQFRRSLTPENMVQASQGIGGPQPTEVARMYAIQVKNLETDRDWLDKTRAKLADASKRLDEAFVQLKSGN
jgi:argininosuccinate lyase